jgi:hypothetical protein
LVSWFIISGDTSPGNPLAIGGVVLTGTDRLAASAPIYDTIRKASDAVRVTKPDGTAIILDPNTEIISSQDGRVLAYQDREIFYFAEIETQYVKPIVFPNNLGIVDGIQTLDGKVLWGVKLDGSIVGASVAAGISPNSITDSDGFLYSSEPDTTGLYQVIKSKGLYRFSLTTLGNNYNIGLSDTKVFFTTDRESLPKNYWINKSGTDRFYSGYYADLFSNTYWHLIQTGQSLSEGQGSTARTTTQLYANRQFNGGIKPGLSGGNLASLTPMIETGTERGIVAATNSVTKFARNLAGSNIDPNLRDITFIGSACGYGGKALQYIKKNPTINGAQTTSYAEAMAQIDAGVTLSAAAGKAYKVLGLLFHHGESDDRDERLNSPNYRTRLLNYYEDYNTDAKIKTGQSENLVMFLSQMSSHTFYNNATPYSAIEQYEAFKANPSTLILTCPKYWLNYVDGVHLDTDGYDAISEISSVAMVETFLQRKPWKPLYPTTIVRTGANVKVTFNVPVAPLVLDTTWVTNPGQNGFEYVNGSSANVAISSVALDPDGVSVNLVLASAVAGKLRYAYTATSGNASGRTTGARGNLSDSAAYPSAYALPFTLKNWCIHFEETVQ